MTPEIEIETVESLPKPVRASLRGNKAGSLHPFKRLRELMAKVELIRQEFVFGSLEYQVAIAALPPYKGRGHGGHHRTQNRVIGGRWSQDRSKYAPHQGKTEAARRVFQAMPAEIRRETRRVEAMI